MIFNFSFLVSHISSYITLMPGDIVTTGTPPGVGLGMDPPVYLQAGDLVELGMDQPWAPTIVVQRANYLDAYPRELNSRCTSWIRRQALLFESRVLLWGNFSLWFNEYKKPSWEYDLVLFWIASTLLQFIAHMCILIAKCTFCLIHRSHIWKPFNDHFLNREIR